MTKLSDLSLTSERKQVQLRPTSTLGQLYDNLLNDKRAKIDMRHSSSHYAKAAFTVDDWEETPNPPKAVREAVLAMSVEEFDDILREEGLLPWGEYGVPRWFVRKHYPAPTRKVK
jgi:hypothetical protein